MRRSNSFKHLFRKVYFKNLPEHLSIYQITARWPMNKEIRAEVLVLKNHTKRGVEYKNGTLQNVLGRITRKNFIVKKEKAPRLEDPRWDFGEYIPTKSKMLLPGSKHVAGNCNIWCTRSRLWDDLKYSGQPWWPWRRAHRSAQSVDQQSSPCYVQHQQDWP